MSNKLHTRTTNKGAVRYVPGFGTKYLMKPDKTVYRRTPDGQYVEVSVSHDGRVRLYHLGTESRRSVDVLYAIVFPDGTIEEIVEQDRGDREGGRGSTSVQMPAPMYPDIVGKEVEALMEEVGDNGQDVGGNGQETGWEGPENIADEFFDL